MLEQTTAEFALVLFRETMKRYYDGSFGTTFFCFLEIDR